MGGMLRDCLPASWPHQRGLRNPNLLKGTREEGHHQGGVCASWELAEVAEAPRPLPPGTVCPDPQKVLASLGSQVLIPYLEF